MKHLALIATLLFSFNVVAQEVQLIKYKELEQKKFMAKDDQLLLINFWATWCGPCIKELPYFERANNRKDVKVLLISVDFPEELEKVKKFVAKKSLTPEIYLLDEKDYDEYMPKVSENWSGAIPATLIIDSDGNRYFYEKAFDEQQLATTIEKHIN